jgi:hypothetical protein
LFHSELRQCELHHGDCGVTQCFNCQKYGHIAGICRLSKKCGLCAAPGTHATFGMTLPSTGDDDDDDLFTFIVRVEPGGL